MYGNSTDLWYMSGIEEAIVVAQIFCRNNLCLLLPLILCLFKVSKVPHWFSTTLPQKLMQFVGTLYWTWYGNSPASVVGIVSKQNYYSSHSLSLFVHQDHKLLSQNNKNCPVRWLYF